MEKDQSKLCHFSSTESFQCNDYPNWKVLISSLFVKHQCYDQTQIDFGNISKEGFFIISFFMINFEINAIASYRNLQRQVPQFDCY